MIQLRAFSIGADALKLTATCQHALVNGITSRGIFILTQDHRVVFISFEGWRGPWTINLTDQKILEKPGPGDGVSAGHLIPINRISIRTRVTLRPMQLLFPDDDVEIAINHLNGWLDIPNPGETYDWSEINTRLDQVVQLVSGMGSSNGWIRLINAAEQEKRNIPENLIEVKDILQDFISSKKNQHGDFQIDRFNRILGRGSGLTPSGDDVVIGLLLALNRSEYPKESGFIEQLSQKILDFARQTTTSLSTCLIASAANGQADERLVSALDGIIYGNLPVKECAARLLAYGSTSGGDSLLGMYTVLKAYYPL